MARSPRLPPSGQSQKGSLEGGHHVDRNAQFEHINTQVEAFQAAGDPVISVDTKKKELVGPYKNAGSDYRPKGCPDKVNVHDFVDKELGKAIPYGVYDIGANVGCVSVGINHDTAQFAVNAIRRWRDTMGRERYPRSGRLMIAADGGGSNAPPPPSSSAIIRPAHPSGTRSNTACSVTSRKIAVAGRSRAGRQSSN